MGTEILTKLGGQPFYVLERSTLEAISREQIVRHMSPIEQAIASRIINRETLIADNESTHTVTLNTEWEEIRRRGQLTLEWDCDDARSRPSRKTVQVRTIATGGDDETYESYKGLINDKSVKLIVTVAHYDGDTVELGVPPTGCGGQDAKLKQTRNLLSREGRSSLRYVHEKVSHHDPVVQAMISASKISCLTDKPVLAAVRNHLTGEVIPLAIFKRNANGTNDMHSSVSMRDCLEGSYRPENIYKNGMPYLEKNDPLLAEYSDYFNDNMRYVGELNNLIENNPDVYNRLKTQDPDAIVISTQTRPLVTRYSGLFTEPGSVFEITAARSKKSTEAETPITNTAVKEILDQLDYAMNNALNPEGHGFRRTRTILIETSRLEESRRIAQAIADTELGIRWLSERRQIIIAEVRGGKIVKDELRKHKIENFYLPTDKVDNETSL
jgi:hypothetical protein